MEKNSENRTNKLKKLLEQTNQNIEKLTGDIITLSYPLETERNELNSFYDSFEQIKGTKVECRIKLNEKGEISQVLSAKKITYSAINKYQNRGFVLDEETTEIEEEIPIDNVDMAELQQNLNFYRENNVLQILRDNKEVYEDSIKLLETTEGITGSLAVSEEGALYDVSPYYVNMKKVPMKLPTGEGVPIAAPIFIPKGKLSEKLKEDLILARDNLGFVDANSPARAFVYGECRNFMLSGAENELWSISTEVTNEGLIEKYDMSGEELKQLALNYEKDKRRLTDLVSEAKRIIEFNNRYDANMLLPIETRMSDLQMQMQKYSSVVGFFRKIFKRQEYKTVKDELTQCEKQMVETQGRQAKMDQQYEAGQLRYAQIRDEFDEVKNSVEQNVDGAEATMCLELMEQVEGIRERLEQKDKSNRIDE